MRKIALTLVMGSALVLLATSDTASLAATTAGDAPAPTVYGMAKAFDAAKKFVPVNKWTGINALQKEFIKDFIGLGADANKLPKSMLGAVASYDVTEINNFIKKHGLTIRLKPFPKDGFGCASVLTIEGKWAAKPTKLTTEDGTTYPAIMRWIDRFYEVPGHAEPVVRIFENSEFSVHVTPLDGADEGFNALRKAHALTPNSSTKIHPKNYEVLVMPMVDMNRTVQLDWLKGMSGNRYVITQAVAQTLLKLDENGFSVKEGFAAVGSRSIKPGYRLNKPFLLWVKVKGLPYPVFAVKVDTKYWKNPNAPAAK